MAGSPWLDSEIETLRSSITKGGSITEMASRANLQRSMDSVRFKISSLMYGIKPVDSAKDRSKVQLLKEQVTRLQGQLAEANKEIASSEKILDLAKSLKETPNPAPWALPKNVPAKVTGIPVLFVSDIHFDEVVDPAQVGGVNRYNRVVAEERIRRLFESTAHLCLDHMKSPSYDGIVVALGGDLLSGNIHEELAETNEAPVLESAQELTSHLYNGIRLLAERFGRVFVPCVVGNHGRLHRKPRNKNRVRDNYDWLVYKNLEFRFKDDKRVTFQVSESSDAQFSVYGKSFLLTHGDQFRGGTGISGIMTPLMLGQSRKAKRHQAVGKPFDTLLVAHFHTYTHSESLIVNGSVKGLDEFAFQNNFGFERPQQALFIVHPVIGISYRMPVLVDSYDRLGKSKHFELCHVCGADLYLRGKRHRLIPSP